MSVCAHEETCPGFGWMHDAQVTTEQRRALGLPDGPISLTKAKRSMRRHRKELHEGALLAEIGALRVENSYLRGEVARLSALVPEEADADQ